MEGQRVGEGNKTQQTLLYLSCADSAFMLISQQINVISSRLFILYGRRIKKYIVCIKFGVYLFSKDKVFST